MKKEDFTNYIIGFIHDPENHITDNIEEVSEGLFYTKTIRIICVLDEKFDDNLDGIISCFYADTVGKTECNEHYPSDYGEIIIFQKENGNVKAAFAAEEEN